MFGGCNCTFKPLCWLFFGHRFISTECFFFFFTSQAQNSVYNTLSKCTNKALGGCCNYFSGFRPGNAANFPGGSPKIGGKPELSLTISSIHSSTHALVHFIYITISKGTNVPRLNIDYSPPIIYNYPSHTHTHTHTHRVHFPVSYFNTYTHITL